MTDQELKNSIEQVVKGNKIVVFMKGTKDAPMCGFSAATVKVFNELKVPFATMDVLSEPNFRPVLTQFSNWPTFPQVFIDGKFVGGCDITRELYQSGELQKLVK